jgi:hypothetical protein
MFNYRKDGTWTAMVEGGGGRGGQPLELALTKDSMKQSFVGTSASYIAYTEIEFS